ncbi:MAG: alkaline phosphatase family protein, partial [Vicinamibacterales bacterium]|nr:alkaline phosphatase family protein [Vicinamibacterales bacterium]
MIRDLYVSMDELVGRVVEQTGPDEALLVLSDHGFKPFRRCVDLNAWLREHGYLTLQAGATTTDMLQGVDWAQTTAYAVGFGGIYLNLEGREAQGVVPDEDVGAVKAELRDALLALRDDEGDGARPIGAVHRREQAYSGPYVDEAPDLFVGFAPGYRSAWKSVTGGLGAAVFSDNTRPWSGDHNMNPADVPGVLFANRALHGETADITDIA